MPAPLAYVPAFGLALSLFSLGCGIEAQGTLDPEDVAPGGLGGSGGRGGSATAGSGGGGIGGQIAAGTGGGDAGSAASAGTAALGGSGGIAGQGGAGSGNISGQAGFAGVAGQAGTVGQGGIAGEGGHGGLAGESGQAGQAGAGGSDVYIPNPVRPFPGQVLTPTHALLSWTMPELPSGKEVNGYEYCATSDVLAPIDDPSQCPGEMMTLSGYAVLDPLTPSSNYRWKVRARFKEGGVSSWSAVRGFSTDGSLIGRWSMDGNGLDSSGAMNDGSLQNGAVFGPGLVMAGLQLDGMNDHMTVSDQPLFNFGTNDFTLSAWIYTQETGKNQVFIEKRDGTNGYLLTRRASGILRFHGDQCGVVDGGVLLHGEWQHVVARRKGATIQIYVDGEEVGSGNCAENFSNSAILTFGCNTPTNTCTEPMSGMMDEVMLFSGTAAEAVTNEFCVGKALSGIDPLPALCFL